MTKDGYYLGEYVVPLEEIRQYMPDGNTDGLNGVTAEATGHVKNIQMLCETATGEKLQCREGTTKYLYNLTQFTITD